MSSSIGLAKAQLRRGIARSCHKNCAAQVVETRAFSLSALSRSLPLSERLIIRSNNTIENSTIDPSYRRQTYLNHHYHRIRRRLGEGRLFESCRRFQSTNSATLTTPSFWRELDDAVEQGNVTYAEELVEGILEEYTNRLQNGPAAVVKNGGTATTEKAVLDGQMFSMFLQACQKDHATPTSIDSALKAQRMLRRMSVLADMGVIGNKPTIWDYTTVLECWNGVAATDNTASAIAIKRAEKIWTMAQDENILDQSQDDDRLVEVFVDVLANTGRGERAEQVLEEYKQRRQARPTRTSKAFSREEGSDIPSMNMCLSVLKAFARSPVNDAPERAEDFLRKMATDPSLPNPKAQAYNVVLHAWVTCKQQGDAASIGSRAESLLREMKKARIQPNAESYQYSMEIFARRGDGERAEALLTNLLKEYTNQFDADLKPSVEHFRTVLWAYSNSYHPKAADQAEAVLRNMVELAESDFNTQPTTLDCNLVLKCWARTRSPQTMQRAMNLYNDMVSFQEKEVGDSNDPENGKLPHPDVTSLNTVLNVSSRHEQPHQTEKLLWRFTDMHRLDPSINPCPDTISFTTAIKSWSQSTNHKAPEKAERLLMKLEELYKAGNSDCKPDLHIYSALLNCWSKSKTRRKESARRAESVLRMLQNQAENGDNDLIPDSGCWNAVIGTKVGDGARAEALFDEMVDNYRSNPHEAAAPNGITITNVLNAWAKTEAPNASHRAVALLERIERMYKDDVLPVKPNVICYSVVLDSLASDRNLSSALKADEILTQMEASNDPQKHPNLVSYNCVIKAWSFIRRSEAIDRLMALLTKVIRQSEKNTKLRPNARTFGSVLKALLDSKIPDKKTRIAAVMRLIEKYDCDKDRWIRQLVEDNFEQAPQKKARQAA